MKETSKPHPDIRKISPEEWNEITDKLMGFTFKYLSLRFEGNTQTPDGLSYEDIAQEIVLRVLHGTRRWDPEKHGDILPYLAGQVQSLVSHGTDSWSARNVISMPENTSEEDDNPILSSLPDTSPTPEMVLISEEYQVEREQFLDTVLEAISQTDDEGLWALAEAYLDDSGQYKRREISSRLGISVSEFDNRRKRLVRQVKKYLSEQSSEIGGQDDKNR